MKMFSVIVVVMVISSVCILIELVVSIFSEML